MDHSEILVLGAGPAGFYAAAQAAARNKNVALAGSEKHAPYYRPQLTRVLSAPVSPEALAIKPAAWMEKNNIAFLPEHTAQKVDTENKKVFWQDQSFTAFDKLVIAAGSHSFMPPIPGVERPFALRSYEDALLIREAAIKAGSAVILGGGLLGLETAYHLNEIGVKVTVFERGAALLSRQLPRQGGEMLADLLSAYGIRFITNADTDKVRADFPDACVIVAAGVRPNTAFLSGSGILIYKAVVVDAQMRTSIRDIYACGDVAEFNGNTPGLFSIAIQQGKTAGANAAGAQDAYIETPPSPTLKIGDLSIFSAGDNQDGDVFFETGAGSFKSVTLKDGILTGGALIGDITMANKLKNAITQKRKFENARNIHDVLNDNL